MTSERREAGALAGGKRSANEGHESYARMAGGEDDAPFVFTCAVCREVIGEDQGQRWWQRQERPPVCFYCANTGGIQVRIPGVSRGDHHQLQRLSVLTKTLRWLPERMKWERRYGAF